MKKNNRNKDITVKSELSVKVQDNNILLNLLPIFSVLLGLLLSSIMMMLLDHNPLIVYSNMLNYAFRDIYNIADIFAKATPLILTGLAFGFAFRASLFNIGAQGQFYIGAVLAVGFALKLGSFPMVLALFICFTMSLLGGSIWAAFIGYVKARFNASEFLVSMMLTYVAIAVMNFLLGGLLKEAKGEYPQTDVIPESGWLPSLIPHTRLHWGFIFALLVALVAYLILWKTSLGYKIRMVGFNRDAARYAGVNVEKIYIIVFFISGAFAGIAGFTEINGMQHMLIEGFNPMIGAEGIGIAILGNAHPLGIVISALLFGALKVGGNLVVQTSRIPASIIGIMEGFVILSVILSYFIRDKLIVLRSKKKLVEQEEHRL
ncbi:MAG: ABC transporter permease [Candidatus Caldatribacteriota bacterium]|nr:ABC transporter permease [Candidatus Caldatribacteriota bacterium]